MSQAVHDVLRIACGHEDRKNDASIVAHHEAVVAQRHLVDFSVSLRERLAHEGRDRRNHASDDIAIFVAHQAAGHVLDQQAVRPDHEDFLDQGLWCRWDELFGRWRGRTGRRGDALHRDFDLLRGQLLRRDDMPEVRTRPREREAHPNHEEPTHRWGR